MNIIFHLDMNAFFASIEQKTNPALRGKPVIVCGNPETRTVVSAASYEAKPFGIKSGMSIGEARRRCPQAVFVIGNLAKYVDTSRRVFRILQSFSPKVEIFSIDEAFIDFTDICSSYEEGMVVGQKIKKSILESLALTCSIGIAPNKLLAKLASEMQKPDGLVLIKPEQVQKILESMPIKELCGIGHQTEKYLKALGIYTCGELGRYPVGQLRQRFGIMGDILHEMGLGIDHTTVRFSDQEPSAKSVGHSHTLDRDITNVEEVKRNILALSEQVAVRMRKDSYCGCTICLVLRYSDFFTFSRHLTVDYFLDSGYDIYQHALKILKRVNWRGKAIRLIGVSVSQLIQYKRELYLLDEFKHNEKIDCVMDTVNNKYGEFTLMRAAMLSPQGNRRQNHKMVQPILSRGLWAKTLQKRF